MWLCHLTALLGGWALGGGCGHEQGFTKSRVWRWIYVLSLTIPVTLSRFLNLSGSDIKNIVRTGHRREREAGCTCLKPKVLRQKEWGWQVLAWSERSESENMSNSCYSQPHLLKRENADKSIIIGSLSSDQLPEVNTNQKKAFSSDAPTLGKRDQWESGANWDGQEGWAGG